MYVTSLDFMKTIFFMFFDWCMSKTSSACPAVQIRTVCVCVCVCVLAAERGEVCKSGFADVCVWHSYGNGVR